MNQQQLQPQLLDWVLALLVGSIALGGIILVVLTLKSPKRYAFAAAIGAVAAIIIEPALKHVQRPELFSYPLIFYLCGVALGVFSTFILRVILDYFTELRDILRDAVAPSRWEPGASHAQLGPKDHVKRWFVTVAAATGSVAGSVLGLGAILDAFAAWREPRNILIALVLVVVSMFLVGPLQAYIFDWGVNAKEPPEPSKKFADVLATGDWRAAGRLGLVMLLYLQIYLLASYVGSTVKLGSSEVLLTIITAAVTPAVVSYYWSAALQRSDPSVQSAIEPSVFTAAIMVYGIALLGVLTFGLAQFTPGAGSSAGQQQSAWFLFFSPIIAIFAALLLSAFTTMPFAVAGGYIIDRMPGRSGMGHLAAALLAIALAEAAILAAVGWLFGADLSDIGNWQPLLLGTAGWALGLLVSGFPRLVSAGRLV